MDRSEMVRRLRAGEDPLELSIQKWQDIMDGKGKDEGNDNCALCERFLDFPSNSCLSCPVRVRTDISHCTNTPYVNFDAYMRPGHRRTRKEKRRLAQLELDFLKSLRKKEA